MTYEQVKDDIYRVTSTSHRLNSKLFPALHAARAEQRRLIECRSAHPSVQLFLELISNSKILDMDFDTELTERQAKVISAAIQDFLLLFQNALNSTLHSKALHNLYRSEKRNQKSIESYVDALFDSASRLLVIRIDLGYRREAYASLRLNMVIKDRTQFLLSVKHKAKGLLGYLWKFEYGVDRQYHYHMTFFFNGSIVRQDITIAQWLGELWCQITRDNGTYYNCNRYREKYQEFALGAIHYTDNQKISYLLKALRYFTKHDEDILALMDERRRIFGRMETPRRTHRYRRILRDL